MAHFKRRQPVRKLTLLLIGFLNTTFAIGQTYSSVTSDKEIYDFLNWMTVNDRKYGEEPKLKRKHIYHKILSWDTTSFKTIDTSLIKQQFFSIDRRYLYQRPSGTDTIFNQQDRDFVFKQFTVIKDTIWYEKFLKSKLLTSNNPAVRDVLKGISYFLSQGFVIPFTDHLAIWRWDYKGIIPPH